MTLPGEHEVKSGSLHLQKVNISSSDYCEKTMEELLQDSYVDMKARTSGIVSKLAFIKTMERGMYQDAVKMCNSWSNAWTIGHAYTYSQMALNVCHL